MEFSVNQVAVMLGGEVKGDGNEKITMLAKIQDAKKGQIAFLSNPKYEQYIYSTQATAVIVKKGFCRAKGDHGYADPRGRPIHQLHPTAGRIS